MELKVRFGADGGFLIKGREKELRVGPFPANRCEASFLPPHPPCGSHSGDLGGLF